jgi:flagellar protein FliO/FliZ
VRIRRLAALALLALLVEPAGAQAVTDKDLHNLSKTKPSGTGTPHVSFSSGGSLVRVLLALAVVVGIILVLNKLVRGQQSRRMGASGGPINVLTTTPLGPNRNLHLIRVGSEVLLIGAGEGGITPLRTYDEDEALAIGALSPDAIGSEARAPLSLAPDKGKRRFVDYLRDFTTR